MRIGVDDQSRMEAPDPSGRLDLPGKPFPELSVLRESGMDQLDCDLPAARRFPRNTCPIPPPFRRRASQ